MLYNFWLFIDWLKKKANFAFFTLQHPSLFPNEGITEFWPKFISNHIFQIRRQIDPINQHRVWPNSTQNTPNIKVKIWLSWYLHIYSRINTSLNKDNIPETRTNTKMDTSNHGCAKSKIFSCPLCSFHIWDFNGHYKSKLTESEHAHFYHPLDI